MSMRTFILAGLGLRVTTFRSSQEKRNSTRKVRMKPWPNYRFVRLKRWLETFWVLSKKLGHFESAWKGVPHIDGMPVPWINYSALEFLELVMPRSGTIFEFGVGASTLWF